MKANMLPSLGALLVTLSLAGCVRMPTWFSPTFSGQVVEQATGQPIAGAIVVGLWEEERSAYVHSRIHCIRAESATTDAQGNYTLLRPGGDLPNRLYAYKSGYRYVEIRRILKPIPAIPVRIDLEAFAGTTATRLDDLSQLKGNASCDSAAETGTLPNLLSLRKAIYQEARAMAKSKEDHAIADQFLWGIEVIELGNRIATERSVERLRNRK